MKHLKFYIIIFVILSISVFFYFLVVNRQVKYAFYDVEKVFNDFTLKKELETKFEDYFSKRKAMLDSLENEYNAITVKAPNGGDAKVNSNKQDALKQLYNNKLSEFDEESQKLRASFNQKVSVQLKEYIEEFAKEKKFDCVFGYDGTGAVSYYSDEYDITSDLIEFVNKKYNAK